MKVFYGAAIQGAHDRKERAHIHRAIINAIKNNGYRVISEHTTGESFYETANLLENFIGSLPPVGEERTVFVRKKMIELLESDIDAAIFEVSTPSLGTGIEIAHAYLRSRIGLKQIPVLALYQKNYWPNKLSSMIKGITEQELPHFKVIEYEKPEDVNIIIPELLDSCNITIDT
ncbi:MAG: hypothetical protein LWX51_11950 [Deltaproteobacteria bacterium]|jgi:hypothetical protein|nr:hypothetical protein [Deltaproteobacteria bacterium]